MAVCLDRRIPMRPEGQEVGLACLTSVVLACVPAFGTESCRMPCLKTAPSASSTSVTEVVKASPVPVACKPMESHTSSNQ